jgi:endonuclease/exonuclease/phosphatase family metal-dependent hydrolase
MWFPEPSEAVEVVSPPETALFPRRTRVRVLSWNIQYAGSRKHHFFYDGGQAAHVPREDVEETLRAIADVIAQSEADVVLLQEVDRGSDRTHRIDEHAWLVERLGYPAHSSAPYHRVGFLPHPTHAPLGRVEMHLTVMSRFALGTAERVSLPLLDEPAWRQAFNLRRQLMTVDLPLQDGGTLRTFNTHLSAFSKGDGTLDKQMAVLDQRATDAEKSATPWLLVGDLNALPPGDDPRRLGADAVEYAEAVTPAQRLFDRHTSVIPAERFAREPEAFRTYIPFGAAEPDRTLDYAFIGREVKLLGVEVLPVTTVSDHLPVLFDIEIP